MNHGLRRQSPQAIRLFLALGLLVLLGCGLMLGVLPIWLGLLYAAMGLLAFAFYVTDKQAARSGAWRVPEMQLHGLDFCFGIIGGLLGQALFRHKTSKPGFVRLTWLIAGLHGAGLLIGLVLPLIHVKPA